MNNLLCEKLNIAYPIIQAPMAGVSTPEMAAAVTNAGALGSISVGASTPEQAENMIKTTRNLTAGPFNVNVFCHARAERNEAQEKAWIERFRDVFNRYDAVLPAALEEIYTTFHQNDAMAEMLLETAPAVVSFHFGIPPEQLVREFKSRGIITIATATSVSEARQIESAGIDFVVAQGVEAGGHRGIFEPEEEDEQLSTFTLVQALRKRCALPVIGAGGIMDGAGLAAMMKLGAIGVQMGTAFVLCPESAANEAYRQALKSEQTVSTVMTSAISGRPARCVSNDFCKLTRELPRDCIPPYPVTYALGKMLAAAATAKGAHGFGAQWAGQGLTLAREMPARKLIQALVTEWQDA